MSLVHAHITHVPKHRESNPSFLHKSSKATRHQNQKHKNVKKHSRVQNHVKPKTNPKRSRTRKNNPKKKEAPKIVKSTPKKIWIEKEKLAILKGKMKVFVSPKTLQNLS